MQVIYSETHRGHDGAHEVINGELVPMFEMPSRMDMVLGSLEREGFKELSEPEAIGLAPAKRVHDAGYLDFLAEAYDLWKGAFPEADYGMPFTFALRGLRQAPGVSAASRYGWYCFDMSVPFTRGTWAAIRSSLDCAITAQRLVAGGQTHAFALCRPPGHHAMKDMGGGYCYINNAAAAAQAFRDGGAGKVAILDVDYHHGNGTQDIFYDRDDVLFASLHGHPDQEYPYFAGFAEERGRDRGEGFNLNYPMRWGTGWPAYREALTDACAKTAAYKPEVLVVSLGVDTFEKDPISHFKLKSPDYLEMGAMIAGLKKPTLFVMEGGYAVEEIGINAVNVLKGYLGG